MDNQQESKPADSGDMGTFGSEYSTTSPVAGSSLSGTGIKRFCSRRALSSNFPTGNILLAGLIVAGMAGVYLLKMHSGPAAASASAIKTQDQVDQALVLLTRNTDNKTSETSNLVEKFYFEANQRQVGISSIGDNPFLFELKQPARVIEVDEPESEKPKVLPQQEQLQMLAIVKVRKLILMSIILTDNEADSSALISNFVLRSGNSIQGWVVEKITSNRVDMCWLKDKDVKFVLTMPE